MGTVPGTVREVAWEASSEASLGVLCDAILAAIVTVTCGQVRKENCGVTCVASSNVVCGATGKVVVTATRIGTSGVVCGWTAEVVFRAAGEMTFAWAQRRQPRECMR